MFLLLPAFVPCASFVVSLTCTSCPGLGKTLKCATQQKFYYCTVAGLIILFCQLLTVSPLDNEFIAAFASCSCFLTFSVLAGS